MTTDVLARLIFIAGLAQLGVLIASAMVPFRLSWRTELSSLSRLHRQMYWVYGGYVVLSIIAFALLSLLNARELAGGSRLARGVCCYIAVFWGIRIVLQGVFDVKEHLTAWWLKAAYYALTVLFGMLALIYACAALGMSARGNPHVPDIRSPPADVRRIPRRVPGSRSRAACQGRAGHPAADGRVGG